MIDGPSKAPTSPPEIPAGARVRGAELPVGGCPRSRRCHRRRRYRPPRGWAGVYLSSRRYLAGLHHEHDAPWAFERGNELLDGLSRHEGPLRAVVSNDRLGPAVGAVEQCDPVSVASHVAGKAAAITAMPTTPTSAEPVSCVGLWSAPADGALRLSASYAATSASAAARWSLLCSSSVPGCSSAASVP